MPTVASCIREIRKKWRPRPPSSHKGDFGRVFVLAGSKGLTGAAHLAAMAALRSGAGLVTLGVAKAVYPILARREAEIMVHPLPSTSEGTLASRSSKLLRSLLKNQDVLALGPGLSQNSDTQKLIRWIVSEIRIPLVLDADGLNAFRSHEAGLKRCAGRAVLTPHPGEFVRLFGGSVPQSDRERRKRAIEAARKLKVFVVLKGHRTVIANPDGNAVVNPTGNPGMATAGSGDVLTGVIAALAGQRFSLWDAARFGVFLHGLAGDLAARKVGEVSLTAGDILSFLPAAVQKIRGRK